VPGELGVLGVIGELRSPSPKSGNNVIVIIIIIIIIIIISQTHSHIKEMCNTTKKSASN
jgi:hypothetical protein